MAVGSRVVQGRWGMVGYGALKGLPIVIGYLPIAISYGILASQVEISLWHTVLMSITVYAGASQFMAVNMILLGAAGVEIVLATLVLNLRHLIMSMSFINRNVTLPRSWQPFLCLGITDETFTMISLDDGADNDASQRTYLLAGLIGSAYLSWVLGSMAGWLLSHIIPPAVGGIMSIALYAMFIALLVPSFRKSSSVRVISALGALFSILFHQFLDQGWAIVLATMAAATCGIFLTKE